MTIDLSSSLAKYNAYILGKQTQIPVPKVREGKQANYLFEQDLCGPMQPVFSSGNLYSMNIMDNFLNYNVEPPFNFKRRCSF